MTAAVAVVPDQFLLPVPIVHADVTTLRPTSRWANGTWAAASSSSTIPRISDQSAGYLKKLKQRGLQV